MIIAISGTPGTGKTTVAKLLGKKTGFRVIGLNDLAEEKKLYSGFDKKRNCHIVSIGKIRKELKKMKGDLIIESHYAHDMDSDILFMLGVGSDELRERGRDKDWKREKIEENVLSELLGICRGDALDNGKAFHEIDTTGKTVEKVVGEILKTLKKTK